MTHRQFAERYVRLASGPYKGHPFKVERQPFTGLLFDQFDSGLWQTIYITGPSQSSKTISGFVIPTLRDAVELREDIVLGIPEADMADDKWRKDFLPTLESSPDLTHLIPTRGPGSKGGKVKDNISLGNHVDLKIITRGGQDTAKAGYTASRIRVTEAAGWSKSGQNSNEANTLRQLIARMRSFKRHSRSLIVEGTVTIPEELPWSARGDDDDEILISTKSRIGCPCPHCAAYVSPEREHLVGWQGAETEQQAADEAVWVCPACSTIITEAERRDMNAAAVLIHHGQTVDKRGYVIGDMPAVSTLWFRWTAFNNLLLDAADTAIDEWKAEQIPEGTQDRENAEKELCQFCHATPYKSKLAQNDPLKPSVIRKRTDACRRNVIPDDTVGITLGVDIGDWTGWWLAIAWLASGGRHICGYGNFDIKRDDHDELDHRIRHGLAEFADGPFILFPRAIAGIDGGYMPDSVAAFVRSQGTLRSNRFHLVRGRGQSENRIGQKGVHSQPRRVSNTFPKVGKEWYGQINYERRIYEYTFNADYWKLNVHEGLRAKPGALGRITLFAADQKNEHVKISNHFANEQLVKKWEPDKGFVEAWVRNGENHWLDCAAIASFMGDFAGFSQKIAAGYTPPETPLADKPSLEKQAKESQGDESSPCEPANFYAALMGK